MVIKVRPKKEGPAYRAAGAVTHSILSRFRSMKWLTSLLCAGFLASGCITSLDGKDACFTSADCVNDKVCVDQVCVHVSSQVDGSVKRDAGTKKDAGSTAQGGDAGVGADAGGGSTPVDGGSTPVDGGSTPVDGGSTPVDGGSNPVDAGLQCPTACHADATCQTASGTPTCVCNSGFEGDGASCFDKNECMLTANICGWHSICRNEPRGSYTCACDTGYGSPSGAWCSDVNECLINNGGCSQTADCENYEGYRACSCTNGTSGDGVTCTPGGWVNVKPVTAANASMAYDTARSQLVVFVLGKTWVWNGVSWKRVSTSGPGERLRAAMAYDSISQRVILTGGNSPYGATFSDTWAWQGSSWVQVSTTGTGLRADATIARLPNGRLLLFGGRYQSNTLTDTWEWDGGTWNQVGDAGPAMRAPSMAYDPVSASVILFGSTSSGAETWSWANSTWTQVVAPGPADRFEANLVLDESTNKLTLFGGANPSDGQSLPADRWQWSGSGWVTMSSSVGPARTGQAAAYDSGRGRLVTFGGVADRNVWSDTWELNGTTWERTSNTAPPAPYHSVAMTYDSARQVTVLLVSTYYGMETWEWNGTDWTKKQVGGPSTRENMAIAETGDGGVLLFGGYVSNTSVADTWLWNGSVWSPLNPSTSPRDRDGHAMAYDPVRKRVVMTGGSKSSEQTWEWNGVWSQSNDIGSSTSKYHAMAYDTAHSQMVSNPTYAGTYPGILLRTGTSWSHLMLGNVGPTLRQGAAMAYDVSRDRVVMVGGDSSSQGFAETWEWNGGAQTWSQRFSRGPEATSTVGLVYDARRSRLVLFSKGETWELVP